MTHQLSRRRFLQVSALGALALPVAMAKPKQPNVLFIIDDQHSPRAMGWTGQTPVKTPALDKLASQSVTFLSGYSASPVCGPMRYSLYTGLFPAQHGVLINDRLPKPGLPRLPELLNDAGYTTASIGKLHSTPRHDRHGFQYCLHHEFFIGAGGISHYAPYLESELDKRGLEPGAPWNRFREPYTFWQEDPSCVAGVNWIPEDITPEAWTTNESLKFIKDQKENRPDKPFFLLASYFPPHHPYRPIKKYADMYKAEDMELPPNFDAAEHANWCQVPNRPKLKTTDDVKEFLAKYYAFTTQLDASIGDLLDGLEDLGVANDTIVIFTSDHGDTLGEHGTWWKDSMYEGSVHVPFMVRWPGIKARRENAPVSHIDLPPTILKAAGAKPPANWPGDDLKPLIGQTHSWPERSVYSEIYHFLPLQEIMIRRGPYKLMARGNPANDHVEFLLHNVERDPYELTELSQDPEHATLFAAMRDELMAIHAKQRQDLPDEVPPVFDSGAYHLTWPADPWKESAPTT